MEEAKLCERMTELLIARGCKVVEEDTVRKPRRYGGIGFHCGSECTDLDELKLLEQVADMFARHGPYLHKVDAKIQIDFEKDCLAVVFTVMLSSPTANL
jgi:hypothetical protein